MLDLDKEFKERWNTHILERKLLVGGLIIGAILLLAFIVGYSVFTSSLNNVDDTYNNELSGKIVNLREYQGHSWIKFHMDSASFVLKNSNNFLLNKPELYNFLQVGDSIYKPIYTDSLTIYRNGKEYLFILGNLTYNLDE